MGICLSSGGFKITVSMASPAESAWMPGSKVTSDGRSEASGTRGISPGHILAPINPPGFSDRTSELLSEVTSDL